MSGTVLNTLYALTHLILIITLFGAEAKENLGTEYGEKGRKSLLALQDYDGSGVILSMGFHESGHRGILDQALHAADPTSHSKQAHKAILMSMLSKKHWNI